MNKAAIAFLYVISGANKHISGEYISRSGNAESE